MFQSARYSHLFLRFGLALIFLWLGIEKFMEPHSWLALGGPQWVESFAGLVGMSPANIFVLTGIFEVLVATSLATAFFEQWFASAAAVFLLLSVITTGFDMIAMYDLGVVGGLLSLVVWPQRRYS